jgi:hypothetical protein
MILDRIFSHHAHVVPVLLFLLLLLLNVSFLKRLLRRLLVLEDVVRQRWIT